MSQYDSSNDVENGGLPSVQSMSKKGMKDEMATSDFGLLTTDDISIDGDNDLEDSGSLQGDVEDEPQYDENGKKIKKKKEKKPPLTAEEKKIVIWQMVLMAMFAITYIVLLIVGITGDYSQENPVIDNNSITIGILFMILCFIFSTANSGIWIIEKFYMIVPTLFLCYFLPGIHGSFNVFVGSGNPLAGVASHYFLPAILCLLCLNVDIPGIMRLGPKAIIVFLTGTLGVVLGGPFAVWFMSLVWPETVEGDAWRGLTYIAGSWIGGGANAVAMTDIFEPSPEALSQAIAVDVFVANIWVAILFLMIGKRDFCNKVLRADPKPVDDLKLKMAEYEELISRVPSGLDFLYIGCLAMVSCGVANGSAVLVAEGFGMIDSEIISYIAFDSVTLWRVMNATILGFILSFTPLRDLEGAGASKVASVMLYFLVLTIGMGMDITSIVENPGIFVLGFIWISVHAIMLMVVCFILKAPLFFLCVGSQANIGGAASAPVVAAQFAPCLAPVGALFAIFGYIIGTWAAWACSLLMQLASPDGT